jgi:hypothetical protein
MVIFGGPLLKAFAFAIFVGVILGTFASVFIASPVLLVFERRGRESLLDLTEEEQKDEPIAEGAGTEAAEGEAPQDTPEAGQTPAADPGEKK